MSESKPPQSTAQKVATNTFWYGLEVVLSTVAALLTSIPVARIIGPEKLGYFAYVQWLTHMSGTLAMVGIPIATRKYMAEYLGRNEPGIVWAVFLRGLRAQAYIALGLLAAGIPLVLRFVEPSYRTCSLLLLINLVPRMLGYIPSNANNAAENLRANFPGAALNCLLVVGLVNLSLQLGWGLTGVAASFLVGTSAELAAKMVMTLRWLHPVQGARLPATMRRRMLRFSGQSLVLMSLNIVVWDRSDLIFLKMLDKDIRQVTFFVLAFNLIEKILMLPQAFSTMMGVSVMAEHGRDQAKLYRVSSLAAKYALLASVPATWGAAALSSPLIRLLYGPQYVPTIPVLRIGAVLAAAKPLLPPVGSLMQAQERQGFLIRWGMVCAAINVLLDMLLIPWAGARGAMLANGVAQTVAIAGVWAKAAASFPLVIPLAALARTLMSGAVMAGAVALIGQAPLPAAIRLALGVPAGALIYFAMIRAFAILDHADQRRLVQLAGRMPARLSRWAQSGIRLLVPASVGQR